MQLIYHKSTPQETSPFDKAIKSLVEGKAIKIACPYLSLSYLKRIIAWSNGEWKLITDVNDWLSSQGSDRDATAKFILDHIDHIHHKTKLHAKALITDDCLFLGSSNFTRSGITNNTELSIVVDEEEQVGEANEWFDELWSATKVIEEMDLDNYVQNIPVAAPLPKNEHRIKDGLGRINAPLIPSPKVESYGLKEIRLYESEELISLAELEVRLKDQVKVKEQHIALALKMVADFDERYSLKITEAGFTLYVPVDRKMFVNFLMEKQKELEVRFIFHGRIEHPYIDDEPKRELKNRSKDVKYLTNVFRADGMDCYDGAIKQLMNDAYRVVDEGRDVKIRERY